MIASSKVQISVDKLQMDEYLLRNEINDSIKMENILMTYRNKLYQDSLYKQFIKLEMHKYLSVFTELEFKQKLSERKAELEKK